MYDCSRGTNRVESVHTALITSIRGENTSIEMPVALLGERRHYHNQELTKRVTSVTQLLATMVVGSLRNSGWFTHRIMGFYYILMWQNYLSRFQQMRALMQCQCRVFWFKNLWRRYAKRLETEKGHFRPYLGLRTSIVWVEPQDMTCRIYLSRMLTNKSCMLSMPRKTVHKIVWL